MSSRFCSPLERKEPPVAQLTQYSGPLHLGLKSLQQLIAVFSVTERYMCQLSIFSKTDRAGPLGTPN